MYVEIMILLEDFILDLRRSAETGYAFNNYFEYMDWTLLEANLEQSVTFMTWFRTVNNVNKESIFDHIYT
jgi:hypothetical protein